MECPLEPAEMILSSASMEIHGRHTRIDKVLPTGSAQETCASQSGRMDPWILSRLFFQRKNSLLNCIGPSMPAFCSRTLAANFPRELRSSQSTGSFQFCVRLDGNREKHMKKSMLKLFWGGIFSTGWMNAAISL